MLLLLPLACVFSLFFCGTAVRLANFVFSISANIRVWWMDALVLAIFLFAAPSVSASALRVTALSPLLYIWRGRQPSVRPRPMICPQINESIFLLKMFTSLNPPMRALYLIHEARLLLGFILLEPR